MPSTQEVQYGDLARRDPEIQRLVAARLAILADRSGRSLDRRRAAAAVKAQIDARLGAIGIDPKNYKVEYDDTGTVTGVDKQNIFERHPLAFTTAAVAAPIAISLLPAVLPGGAAGGAGGAGAAGGTGAATAGGSTLANWLTGLSIGSMALDVYGRIKAGQAAKADAEYNAGIAESLAEDAIERGGDEEQRFRLQVRGLIGSQRAHLAGQGVDIGVGSAVDVQADAAYLGELDARQIRKNAAREAEQHRQDAENLRRGGANAQREMAFGAASTVLGGTTSLLQARYGFGRGA